MVVYNVSDQLFSSFSFILALVASLIFSMVVYNVADQLTCSFSFMLTLVAS